MNFVARTGRSYSNKDELQKRFQIFSSNMLKAQVMNAQEGQENYGATTFADWTTEEFDAFVKRGVRGYPSIEEAQKLVDHELNAQVLAGANPEHEHERYLQGSSLPLTVNWETKAPPVQNQQQCGSCWSFSTCGCLGAQYAVQNCISKGVACDEQTLVRCDTSDHGCNGGWQMNAMGYIDANGITFGNCYAYTATNGACAIPTSCPKEWKGKLSKGYCGGFPTSSADLKSWLDKGPLMIAIDACGSFMQLWYSCAIFKDDTGTKCNSDGSSINHAVELMGYGTSGGEDYFLLKNSWGCQWGCEGLLYIYDSNNQAPAPRNTCNLGLYPMWVKFTSC